MRSYRKFLAGTGDTLLDVLRVMENEGWHHQTSSVGAAYQEVVKILEEITERARWYIDAKTTGEARVAAELSAAADHLDRLVDRYRIRSGRDEDRQLDEYSDDRSPGRLDGDASSF